MVRSTRLPFPTANVTESRTLPEAASTLRVTGVTTLPVARVERVKRAVETPTRVGLPETVT
jgi:hypothetical protein